MKSANFNLHKLVHFLTFAIGSALLAFTMAPAAHADAISNFNLDGCSGGCGSTPFGTVDVQQIDPDTVQISVTLATGNDFVTTGSHVGFAFNIQGSAVTLGTLPTGWVDAGTNVSQPAFGTFSNGIDCSTGNSNGHGGCAGSDPWAGTLTFDVTRSSGLSLTDFVANSSGNYFTTDILAANGHTGPVGADTYSPPTTPEPATLALLGSGFILAGIGIRRRYASH